MGAQAGSLSLGDLPPTLHGNNLDLASDFLGGEIELAPLCGQPLALRVLTRLGISEVRLELGEQAKGVG